MKRLRSSAAEHSLGKGKVTGSILVEGSTYSFSEFSAIRHFQYLDGVRFLSILCVLIAHIVDSTYGLGQFEAIGNVGVWLFFSLSGFLIATLLLREKARGPVDLKAFYKRRMLRIFPLYFLILAFYIVATPRLEPDPARIAEFNRNLPHFLTFTFNIVMHPSNANVIFFYSWSLCAEEQFYAIWPIFAKCCRPVVVVNTLICLIGVSYAHEIGWLMWFPFLSLPWRIIAMGIVEPIMLGVLLAYGLQCEKVYNWLRRLTTAWLPLAGLGVAVALLPVKLNSEYWYGKWTHPLIQFALMALLVTTLVRPKFWGDRLLSWTPVVYLGKISFGLYMWNVLSINLAEKLLPGGQPFALLIASTILTAAVASLSFHFYERIFLNLKDKMRQQERQPE